MNWLKVGLAAAIAAGVLYWGHTRYEAGRADVLATWTASQLGAEQAVRQLESTWQERVDIARGEGDAKVKSAVAAAGRAASSVDRLHDAALDNQRRACKATQTSDRPDSSGLLLADVLGQLGRRAAALAEYADRERIAREECQAAWPR